MASTNNPVEITPLSESAWQALESGSAHLLPGRARGAADDGYIAGLWAAVVAEFRALHRDLALHPRAPASFLFQGKAIVRTLRVLERSLRPGRESRTGPWRLGREDGRNDDGQAFVQYTLSHASGGSAKHQTNLLLIEHPSQARSGFYPLPFETAILEESDVTGRSVVQVVERDEGDAVFVGTLTTRGEKPTGSPTDFGVLLRQDGTQEWSGGPLARQSLEESARLAAAEARLAAERIAASDEPAGPTAEPPAAPPTVAPEAIRREPRRPSHPPSGSRRATSAGRSERQPERMEACAACGAALPSGADFCPACGARSEAGPPSRPTEGASSPARCARCQATLTPGARFCPSCGAAAAPTREPGRRGSGSAGCPGCGEPLSPSTRFCPKCGQPTAAASATVTPASCTRCGASNRSGARFCRGCGAPLGTVASAPGPNGGAATTRGSSASVGSRVCGSCGSELGAGARFCRRCGAPRS